MCVYVSYSPMGGGERFVRVRSGRRLKQTGFATSNSTARPIHSLPAVGYIQTAAKPKLLKSQHGQTGLVVVVVVVVGGRSERRTRNPITEPPFPIRTIVVPGAGEHPPFMCSRRSLRLWMVSFDTAASCPICSGKPGA